MAYYKRGEQFLCFVVVLTLYLLTFLSLTSVTKAEPKGSTIQLMNTGEARAVMVTRAYDSTGATTVFSTDTVNAKGTASIQLFRPGGLAGSNYAGTVSEQNTAVMVYGPGPNRDAKGLDAYPAETEASATVYLPLVVRNFAGMNTMIRIMNTSETSQNVDIFFYETDGTEATSTAYSATVPSNAIWTVDIDSQGTSIGIGDGFLGSAQLEGTGPLAAVAQLYTDEASAAYLAPLLDSSRAVRFLYFPWVRRGASSLTATLYFLNIDNSPATSAVSIYNPAGSLVHTEIFTLPPKGLHSINLSVLAELTDGEYSIVTSSDLNIIALALHQSSSGTMCSYSPSRVGSTEFFLPFVKKGSEWSTSIKVINVSAASLTINYLFRRPDGSNADNGSVTDIPANSSVSLSPSLETFEGSCTVESSGSIFGIALVMSSDGDNFCYPAIMQLGLIPVAMPHLVKTEVPSLSPIHLLLLE